MKNKSKYTKGKVIEYYSAEYGCSKCRKETVLPQIKKGKDDRAHIIYGIVNVSTVAWIMYQKYFNGMPFFRQMPCLSLLLYLRQ